jgi:all-trans-retinol 13,14-reductase
LQLRQAEFHEDFHLVSSKIDAVVIGSGISGLTAAALLAKDGRRVIVTEQNNMAGGALRRFRRNGIPFDIGFHYSGGLGKGQILQVLWEHLGIWPSIEAVPLHPEGYDLFTFRNSPTEVRAHYSYDLLKEELCRVFPTEKAGIENYLATINDVCSQIPFYNLEMELAPFLRDFTTSSSGTVAEVIASLTDNLELQSVLAAPVFLHGVPPSHTDIAMHAAVAHGYYSGAFGIKGGGQAVVDALLEKFQEEGVEVLTGCQVEKINISDEKVTGVIAGGKEIATDQVIYTGHPHHLPDLVSTGSFRPAFTSRLRDLKDTASMFVVFGRIEDPDTLPELDLANIYNVEPGLDLISTPDPALQQGSMMITAPGRRDGRASKASEGVILMRPASWEETSRFSEKNGSRSPGYQEWKEATTTGMMARAAESFGNAYSNIKPLASGSPLTFRDELGAPAGGVYGVQHSIDQYVARARTKVQGLHLSGQGSLMTGLLGASMAGLVTVGEIIGLEKVWKRVRNCQ